MQSIIKLRAIVLIEIGAALILVIAKEFTPSGWEGVALKISAQFIGGCALLACMSWAFHELGCLALFGTYESRFLRRHKESLDYFYKERSDLKAMQKEMALLEKCIKKCSYPPTKEKVQQALDMYREEYERLYAQHALKVRRFVNFYADRSSPLRKKLPRELIPT